MSEPETAEDHALMERVASRDPSALAALYDRHGSLLLALCVRVLKDRMEAEEVVGDVFFELWERHERYRIERGSPVAYLLTLARSRAVDRLRSQSRKKSRTVAIDDAQPLDAAPDDPFRGSVLSEERRHVVAALTGLTDVQRQALELAYYDGLSHSEIAEALNEPLGTIKTRIRQGLIQLRRSLTDFHEARG